MGLQMHRPENLFQDRIKLQLDKIGQCLVGSGRDATPQALAIGTHNCEISCELCPPELFVCAISAVRVLTTSITYV